MVPVRLKPRVTEDMTIACMGDERVTHFLAPDGTMHAEKGAVSAIPTLRGYMLGFTNFEGVTEYVSNCKHCLTPLQAMKAVQMLDGMSTFLIEGDDELWELNRFALMCNGLIGVRDEAIFASKFNTIFSNVAREFHTPPCDLDEFLLRYAPDDGTAFRESVSAMMPYLAMSGTVSINELDWLSNAGLIS